MGHHDKPQDADQGQGKQDQGQSGQDQQGTVGARPDTDAGYTTGMTGGPATSGGLNPTADDMTGGTGTTSSGTGGQSQAEKRDARDERALDDHETWGQGSSTTPPSER